MRALFVSDVHLAPGDDARMERFVAWLGRHADADVYILGDLVDYWLGSRHLAWPDYRPLLDGLARLTKRGARIKLQPGNRDFLVRGDFTRATGVELIRPEVRLALDGRTFLLAHGDFLFNRNFKYSAYRRTMKLTLLRDAVDLLPEAATRGLVRRYRRVSQMTTPDYAWSDADLLRAAMRHFDRGVDVLVAGHIHQPRHLRFDRDGRPRDLVVLGDWIGASDYAEWSDGTLRMLRPST